MSNEEDKPLIIPWMSAITSFENYIPKERMPFIRTKHLNKKSYGCFICGRKSKMTRHHIRRGHNPLAVYICRKHHDIIHGIAFDKLHKGGKRRGEYIYTDNDLRMVLGVASEFKLFKTGERRIVSKKILIELDIRKGERKNNNNL